MSSIQSRRIEKTAKSTDEAIQLALDELGASRDMVEIEVLEEATKGLFGILGGREAKVAVTLKETQASAAKTFLDDLFYAMGMNVSIDMKDTGDALDIKLSGDDMGIIIGKRGDTLDAIQYLTSLAANRVEGSYVKVSVDTENYREKRKEALVALANRIADKVAKTGRRHTFEPMNPYERRVLHATLQDHEQVHTYSVGEEPNRKVVIAPGGGDRRK